jgi:hypothetical protein
MTFKLLKSNIKRWCVQSSDWKKLKMLNYFKHKNLRFLTTHEYKNTKTKLSMLCFIHKQPSFHRHVQKKLMQKWKSKDKNSSPCEFIFQEFFHLDLWSIIVTNYMTLPPLKLFTLFFNFLHYIEIPTSTNNYKRFLQNDLIVIIYTNKMNIENWQSITCISKIIYVTKIISRLCWLGVRWILKGRGKVVQQQHFFLKI